MAIPSGPKRAVTVAPLPSSRYLKFRSRTFAAASTMAQVMRASSAVGCKARDGVAGCLKESFDANIKNRPLYGWRNR